MPLENTQAVEASQDVNLLDKTAKKILIKCKTNTYFVLIAKTSILDTKFKNLLEELDKVINVK